MLSDLTDAGAVRSAVAEYDQLGRDAYLAKYGFEPSRRYFLEAAGRQYDSKAIIGAAYGYQYPDRGPLTPSDFSGGEATVGQTLERLGFTVVDTADSRDLCRALSAICDELVARDANSDLAGPAIADLIRTQAVPAVENLVGGRGPAVGRAGIGSAADVPWVAIFPPADKVSAQVGFYLVYLFAKDGSKVYLSLNQGTEKVRGGLEPLQKRALDLRRVVGGQPDLVLDIDLRSTNTRPRKYEAGSAYALAYTRDAMPDDTQLAVDLDRMLELMRQAIDSGLHWDPEIEPFHLVFKWNADIEPRTLDLHREVADRQGSVWWGRFSKSPTPSIAKRRVQGLQEQLSKGTPTHVYLYRKGSLWRTTLQEISLDPPSVDDPRFPNYYEASACNFFARITQFEPLEPQWLAENAVLASQPDPEPQRLIGALSNQTTPLFVYELFAQSVGVPPPVPVPSDVDISTVTLSDVCADVAAHVRAAGLDYGKRHDDLVRTTVVSLATKRFLILTGLSGSGKTRLGIAIGQWFGSDRLMVVAVRPDWNGPDALLGFENGLSTPVDGSHAWTVPEVLEFVLRALAEPENPYLLLLDEMNLAHVERYFADVLSGMESGSPIVPNVARVAGEWRIRKPARLPFPGNLFVVGTVNIDETTYMFSPKVLDRANTIEFRVLTDDLDAGAAPPSPVEPGNEPLVRRFLNDSTTVTGDDWDGRSQLADWLSSLHRLLLSYDREFGHRVFVEALRFGALLSDAGEVDPLVALDLQVMQKVLPRLHGSIRQVSEALQALGSWCFHGPGYAATSSFDPVVPPEGKPTLPVSFDKIQRMTRRLRANHFVSFAE